MAITASARPLQKISVVSILFALSAFADSNQNQKQNKFKQVETKLRLYSMVNTVWTKYAHVS